MAGEGTILVVDDDSHALALSSRVLRAAGYEVIEAETGADAIGLARQCKPDLVLLDRVLPDMDGTTVCQTIKSAPGPERVFVVYLSAIKTSSDCQAEGLEGGADGYIARPISPRELVARVEAMMRIKRSEDERERLVVELEAALAKIRALSGLLHICASCKKIRDEEGQWHRLEEYITQHSEAIFSHDLCPECARRLFPNQFP